MDNQPAASAVEKSQTDAPDAFFLTTNGSADSECSTTSAQDNVSIDGDQTNLNGVEVDLHQQRQFSENVTKPVRIDATNETKPDVNADEVLENEPSGDEANILIPEVLGEAAEDGTVEASRKSPRDPADVDKPAKEPEIETKKKISLKRRKKLQGTKVAKAVVANKRVLFTAARPSQLKPSSAVQQRRSRSAEPAAPWLAAIGGAADTKTQTDKERNEKGISFAVKNVDYKKKSNKLNSSTANKKDADKTTKSRGRHVSFDEQGWPAMRQRSKSATAVIVPPVSNEIKMLQKLAELQCLITRDYREEARLCYKRSLAESGNSALLKRWAMEYEAQRQLEVKLLQQQQQEYVGQETPRRHIVRPETAANRLGGVSAPARLSKRSSRPTQEKQSLPPVKG